MNDMTMTTERLIEFVDVTISKDEVNSIAIDYARREAMASRELEPNGIVSVKPDNYGGFIVSFQKAK